MKKLMVIVMCALLTGCGLEVSLSSTESKPQKTVQYDVITPMKTYRNVLDVSEGFRWDNTNCMFSTEDTRVHVYGTFIVERKEI